MNNHRLLLEVFTASSARHNNNMFVKERRCFARFSFTFNSLPSTFRCREDHIHLRFAVLCPLVDHVYDKSQ